MLESYEVKKENGKICRYKNKQTNVNRFLEIKPNGIIEITNPLKKDKGKYVRDVNNPSFYNYYFGEEKIASYSLDKKNFFIENPQGKVTYNYQNNKLATITQSKNYWNAEVKYTNKGVEIEQRDMDGLLIEMIKIESSNKIDLQPEICIYNDIMFPDDSDVLFPFFCFRF